MPPAAQLIFLYAGCEKLAAIIDGVASSDTIGNVLKSGYYVRLKDLTSKCSEIGLVIDEQLLARIFNRDDPASARQMRHLLMHQLGPSHAKKLNAAAASLVPDMRDFLDHAGQVKRYISTLPAQMLEPNFPPQN